jgi:hypothetical protein
MDREQSDYKSLNKMTSMKHCLSGLSKREVTLCQWVVPRCFKNVKESTSMVRCKQKSMDDFWFVWSQTPQLEWHSFITAQSIESLSWCYNQVWLYLYVGTYYWPCMVLYPLFMKWHFVVWCVSDKSGYVTGEKRLKNTTLCFPILGWCHCSPICYGLCLHHT